MNNSPISITMTSYPSDIQYDNSPFIPRGHEEVRKNSYTVGDGSRLDSAHGYDDDDDSVRASSDGLLRASSDGLQRASSTSSMSQHMGYSRRHENVLSAMGIIRHKFVPSLRYTAHVFIPANLLYANIAYKTKLCNVCGCEDMHYFDYKHCFVVISNRRFVEQSERPVRLCFDCFEDFKYRGRFENINEYVDDIKTRDQEWYNENRDAVKNNNSTIYNWVVNGVDKGVSFYIGKKLDNKRREIYRLQMQ